MAFYPCTNKEIDKLVNGSIVKYQSSSINNIRNSAFLGCANLENVDVPNALSIAPNAFRECVNLTELKIPSVTYMGSNVLYGCNRLAKIDLYNLSQIPTGGFYGCSLLGVVILRADTMVSIAGTQPFTNTPFDVNGTGGKLYVPQALIATYQANAQWASLLALNANNQILAIEGSPYDN